MPVVNPIQTVCVIDDDEIYAYGIKKFITVKQLSNNIIEFRNGQQAINFLQDPKNADQLPDIIFLDINMPVLDGWGFMEQFSQIKPHLGKKITIYMISSSISEIDIDRSQKISDIKEYLIKPVSHDKLIELLTQQQ